MKIMKDRVACGKFSRFTLSVWASFVRTLERPDAVPEAQWNRWIEAASAPPYIMWADWCGQLKVPFENLLLKMATHTTVDADSPQEVRYEAVLRDTVMRKFYGKVNPRYYPLLDRLLSKKVDYGSTATPTTVDLRECSVELHELRVTKWNKIRTELKLKAWPMPPGLDDFFKNDEWAAVMNGKGYPPVQKAGYVAAAFGISYDSMFEVYTFAEITGDEDSERTRRCIKGLRTRFNKAWPSHSPDKVLLTQEVKEKRNASRIAAQARRKALLLESYHAAVARSIAMTEAGDLRAAGVAKADIHMLEMHLGEIGENPGNQEGDAPATDIGAAVMKIDPTTGTLEIPTPRKRKPKAEALPKEPAALPPPPPPPPPPIVMPVDDPNSYAAILARHPPPPLPDPSVLVSTDTNYRAEPPPSLTSIMDM